MYRVEVHGLVLAAGAGRRFGGPKALARAADGTAWIALAVRALEAAGCASTAIVLGAAAAQARPLVPAGSAVVLAADWADGMGASLAAGIDAVPPSADAVLVTLVDLPSMPAEVARRVAAEASPGALRRAVVRGRPTHPVLIGRDHLGPLRATLQNDAGARDYLAAHGADPVEVGDLWDGEDVDRPSSP